MVTEVVARHWTRVLTSLILAALGAVALLSLLPDTNTEADDGELGSVTTASGMADDVETPAAPVTIEVADTPTVAPTLDVRLEAAATSSTTASTATSSTTTSSTTGRSTTTATATTAKATTTSTAPTTAKPPTTKAKAATTAKATTTSTSTTAKPTTTTAKATTASTTTTSTTAKPTSTTAKPTTTAKATTTSTTATTAPKLTTIPTPDGGGNRDYERRVIELTNAERADAGCPALTSNDRLRAAAYGHSKDMSDNDYFSHTAPDGSTMADRINEQGYGWSGLGENIAWGYPTPESVVQGWMNSPGHRANIENCNFTEIGVGYYDAYWTQNFGTPG